YLLDEPLFAVAKDAGLMSRNRWLPNRTSQRPPLTPPYQGGGALASPPLGKGGLGGASEIPPPNSRHEPDAISTVDATRPPIALATGFVDEVFEGNTIDARGGRKAAGLVLVGNHFGTVVRRNHLLGGGNAWRITAAPTEVPRIWGWSHAPFLGGVIEDNTIED